MGNKVFNAKCQLPREVDAKEFLADGDKDGNGCLDEQELDDDFHSYGELVDGETHAYMLVLEDEHVGVGLPIDQLAVGVEVIVELLLVKASVAILVAVGKEFL